MDKLEKELEDLEQQLQRAEKNSKETFLHKFNIQRLKALIELKKNAIQKLQRQSNG